MLLNPSLIKQKFFEKGNELPTDLKAKISRAVDLKAQLELCKKSISVWEDLSLKLFKTSQFYNHTFGNSCEITGVGLSACRTGEEAKDLIRILQHAQVVIMRKIKLVERYVKLSAEDLTKYLLLKNRLNRKLAQAKKKRDAAGIQKYTQEYDSASWKYNSLYAEVTANMDFFIEESEGKEYGLGQAEMELLIDSQRALYKNCAGVLESGVIAAKSDNRKFENMAVEWDGFMNRNKAFVVTNKNGYISNELEQVGCQHMSQKDLIRQEQKRRSQIVNGLPAASAVAVTSIPEQLEEEGLSSADSAKVSLSDADVSEPESSPRVLPPLPPKRASVRSISSTSTTSSRQSSKQSIQEPADSPREPSGTLVYPTKTQSLPQPVETDAEFPDALPICEDQIQSRIDNAFLIGETNGWGNYIDRNTGDEFFLNTSKKMISLC